MLIPFWWGNWQILVGHHPAKTVEHARRLFSKTTRHKLLAHARHSFWSQHHIERFARVAFCWWFSFATKMLWLSVLLSTGCLGVIFTNIKYIFLDGLNLWQEMFKCEDTQSQMSSFNQKLSAQRSKYFFSTFAFVVFVILSNFSSLPYLFLKFYLWPIDTGKSWKMSQWFGKIWHS